MILHWLKPTPIKSRFFNQTNTTAQMLTFTQLINLIRLNSLAYINLQFGRVDAHAHRRTHFSQCGIEIISAILIPGSTYDHPVNQMRWAQQLLPSHLPRPISRTLAVGVLKRIK
jgi:hypothetical protein